MIEIKEKNNVVLIHLSLIHGVGPIATFALLRMLYQKAYPTVLDINWAFIIDNASKINLTELYFLHVSDIEFSSGLSHKTAQIIVDGLKDVTLLHKEIDLAAKYAIVITTILDKQYPELLRHITHPPIVLYYQGTAAPIAKRIAFVGARNATTYGNFAVSHLIPDLVNTGWEIVSGGAEGADTMAHQAALRSKGTTIAIIGSGLLVPYPKSNYALFDHISAMGGCVLSPFALQTAPERGNFPMRNRIIAGMSQGCVVIQAAKKSGALITAHYALEQGRQVFAIPGPIDNEFSVGCNALIQQGAKLVQSSKDILEEFGEILPMHQPLSTNVSVTKTTINIVKKENKMHNDHSISLLHHFLAKPLNFDEFVEKSGMEDVIAQNYLFELQLAGKIKQNFVGTWEIIER